MKLKITIVDDHSLFREGLKFLLSNCDFIDHITEASNGKEFMLGLNENLPDIIMMDIDMPIMDGVEASKACLKIFPEAKIIALSMHGSEAYYTEMIDAGAKGFLLKNSKFEDVQRAILEVYKGNNYFSPEILDGIIRNLTRKNSFQPKDFLLSERETEVLYFICKGLSNQEIADNLALSKRTVDKHRENIMQKSQLKNTAELVVFAIKNKLFEI